MHELHLAVSARGLKSAWAWRLVAPDGSWSEHAEPAPGSSAYRLRFLALAHALEQTPPGTPIEVVTTDSTTIDVLERWMPSWAADGFRKKGLKERDLIRRLAPLMDRFDLTTRHLASRKGDMHAKDCSARARAAADTIPDDAELPRDLVQVRADVPLVAWTDGGCRGNPGLGGWGVVLVHKASGTTLQARGGEPDSTNNRMELTAIREALASLQRPARLELRTDSRFAIDALTRWRIGWKRRGWRKASGEPPAHVELFVELDSLLNRHDVVFTWVPGHAGEPGNERADQLCNHAMDAMASGEDPSWSERADQPPFDIAVAPD